MDLLSFAANIHKHDYILALVSSIREPLRRVKRNDGEIAAKHASDHSTRHRHKLNMLEPGTRMLKIAALLSIAGIAALLLKMRVGALNAIAMCKLNDEQKRSDGPHL